MKKIVLTLSSLVFAFGGCQKNPAPIVEKVAQLEKRIEVLEKRLTAPAQPMQPPEQTAAYNLPVGDSKVLGNPAAPVTITYVTDMQCPFCERAHNGFIKEVMKNPDLKDKVKVVFKHFPLSFHKNARPAVYAAEAAGEQGTDCFWQMVDKLYTGQKDLSEENFKKWAQEVQCGKSGKLDVAKWQADFKNNTAKYDGIIKKDMEVVAVAQVNGTPSFFVNGWKLQRRDVDALNTLIKDKNLLAGTKN